MDTMNNKPHGPTCSCPHHKVIPATIMLVGFAMLIDQLSLYHGLTMWAIAVGLVVTGCVKFFESSCKCC